jgi:hypothetical protein
MMAEQLYGREAVYAAYVKMAKIYRPEAPSDGFGNIPYSRKEMADPGILNMEAKAAALKWGEADDDMEHKIIGCSSGSTAAAQYLALQAAQKCCAGTHKDIRAILQLAIATLRP